MAKFFLRFKKLMVPLLGVVLITSILLVSQVSSEVYADNIDKSVLNSGQTDTTQQGGYTSYGADYSKPNVSDVSGIDTYPKEKGSEGSAEASEKSWYEYIVYSKNEVGYTEIDPKTRVYFYDPFDYSYGMIMETDEAKSDNEFSSASSITKIITSSSSKTESSSESLSSTGSVSIGFKEKISGVEFGTSISFSFGMSWSNSDTKSEGVSESKTYNATHFNADGTVLQWRLVHYTVYMPLYCKGFKMVKGEWVDTNEAFYYLMPTIQGVAKQWIKNGVVYMEHWGTGEAVTADDFWEKFFTADGLKEVYQNKLLPQG